MEEMREWRMEWRLEVGGWRIEEWRRGRRRQP
jgi:hypothetical protein